MENLDYIEFSAKFPTRAGDFLSCKNLPKKYWMEDIFPSKCLEGFGLCSVRNSGKEAGLAFVGGPSLVFSCVSHGESLLGLLPLEPSSRLGSVTHTNCQ